MPFGSLEEAFKNASTLAYLTTKQALVDYVVLVTDLKRNLFVEASLVILFGGSYGGMLVAWMRLKYPHIAIGVIASSAPILQFEDLVPLETYYDIISIISDTSCFDTIKNSWDVITSMGQKANGLDNLADTFHLCRKLKSIDEFSYWLESMYTYLAMANYPYPSDFFMPLPAYPIKEVCKAIDDAPDETSILDRILKGATVYYNYTGKSECFELGNKAHLADFQEFKGGSISFGGSNGRITSKGKIKTGKLDFEDGRRPRHRNEQTRINSKPFNITFITTIQKDWTHTSRTHLMISVNEITLLKLRNIIIEAEMTKCLLIIFCLVDERREMSRMKNVGEWNRGFVMVTKVKTSNVGVRVDYYVLDSECKNMSISRLDREQRHKSVWATRLSTTKVSWCSGLWTSRGWLIERDRVDLWCFIAYGLNLIDHVVWEVLPADMEAQTKAELNKKAHRTVILCLGNKVLREVTGETTTTVVGSNLETLYMTKSLANKSYLGIRKKYRLGINAAGLNLTAAGSRLMLLSKADKAAEETEGITLNYPIWQVIQNGNGHVSITTDTNDMIKVLPPKTAEEVMAREKEKKARTTLLMALLEDHLAKFHKMDDVKEMWEAIKSRFGGNDESKKMQKYLLKQQFKGFSVSASEGLHKGYDSFDDLYNNLRVFERDVKSTTASSSSSNTQNVAFVSTDNANSTSDISTAYSVSFPSVSKSQKEGSSSYTDEVAMISMRIKKFHKRTCRKLQFDTKDLVRFDKTKVECFNFYKMRHFARDCRAKGNQDSKRRDAGYNGNKARDNGTRHAYQDDSKALVTIDGEDIEWSGYVEEDA
nr:lysosomal Pro-X carboxypeptidase [Tanacetum cinerariifolium]